MQLLEAGRVAVLVITEPFRALAATALRSRGWGDIPVVVLDRDLERLDATGLAGQADLVASVITQQLDGAA